MSDKRRIELLSILAKGCKIHPAYRAIRPCNRPVCALSGDVAGRLELTKIESEQ